MYLPGDQDKCYFWPEIGPTHLPSGLDWVSVVCSSAGFVFCCCFYYPQCPTAFSFFQQWTVATLCLVRDPYGGGLPLRFCPHTRSRFMLLITQCKFCVRSRDFYSSSTSASDLDRFCMSELPGWDFLSVPAPVPPSMMAELSLISVGQRQFEREQDSCPSPLPLFTSGSRPPLIYLLFCYVSPPLE